ncbi:hypothetical protein TNCV_1178871 [Trichonephila clavipes]|nr:hypothetical protein TNCV_1178871 [Trichonephila clavipes]
MCVCGFNTHSSLSKPQTFLYLSPVTAPHQLTSRGSIFQFIVNSQVEWEAQLPDHYIIQNQQFTFKDACHGQPDASKVPATDPALYKYLEKDKLVSFSQLPSFKSNASTM